MKREFYIRYVVNTPDAQQYGHDEAIEDLDSIEACEEVWECADGCCTNFMPRHNDERIRLAAYIERLEAERAALLAEHEAVGEGYGDETDDADCDCLSCRIIRAHDNAERMIHGE